MSETLILLTFFSERKRQCAVVTTVYDSTCKVCDVAHQLYRAFIYVQRSRQPSANERIFHEIREVDKDAKVII